MAFHHHHHHPTNHHQTTTTTACHCCPQPYPPPTQPPYLSLPTDPHLLTTLLTLLHQTPQQHQTFQDSNFHQTNKNPSKITQNQTHPHHKTHQDALLSTLFERIGALEAAFHSLSLTTSSASRPSSCCSSSSPVSLREAAARIIQTHFRSFLVGRSRTLRELKELASVKSTLSCLKLSFSRNNGFVDFDSTSRRALDLLLQLDSIQSGDQMIRDSKRSITREIVQFLDLVDGACVKRHQTLTRTVKNVRLVRNDNRTANGYGRDVRERAAASKCRNAGSGDKKLIANLRDRVERIGRLSKALENEDEDEEGENYKNASDEDDDVIVNSYPLENGGSVKRHGLQSNAKKRVCFVENGDVIRVYDIDRNSRGTSPVLEEIEHSAKGRQDEEAHSDGEQSSQCSEDVKNGTSDEVSEDQDDNNEFTFPAPEPAKMEGRPRLMTSKTGVKIVG